MSTAVEHKPRAPGQMANAFEADYARFCTLGRPITVVVAAATGIAFVALFMGFHHESSNELQPWEILLVELLFVVPAVIVAIRGRRYLKSILLGKLTPLATIWVGVGTGFGCVALSCLLYVDFTGWPSFDGSGFIRAFGTPPILVYLFGPFSEEMFYQVGLQTWLQRYGPIAAVLGASAPFWGTHLYGGFVPMHDALMFLLPAILSYTLVRQTTKSFGASVLAHSTYNVLISCLAFTPRS